MKVHPGGFSEMDHNINRELVWDTRKEVAACFLVRDLLRQMAGSFVPDMAQCPQGSSHCQRDLAQEKEFAIRSTQTLQHHCQLTGDWFFKRAVLPCPKFAVIR
jgi:hypothetical protein